MTGPAKTVDPPRTLSEKRCVSTSGQLTNAVRGVTRPCAQTLDHRGSALRPQGSRRGSVPSEAMSAPAASPPRLVVRRSETQLAGRRFEPEAEARLEPYARAAIKQLPGAHRGVMAIRELPGPFGVPDFVAMVGGQASLEARADLSVAPLRTEVDARLVAAAPARGSSMLDDLACASGLPSAIARRRVDQLIDTGALMATFKGGIRRSGSMQPLGTIFAVEMKVADWRRALSQCRRYHVWADSYVLVMSALSPTQLEKLVNVVESDGGGLVVDGTTICRARRARQKPMWQRLLAAEHFFAATRYGVQPSA